MNLDVLKSTVHVSKWGDSYGGMSLSFEVVPESGYQIDIGEKYLFASSRRLRVNKERELIGALVSITSNADVLANVKVLFPEEQRSICGYASFYKEREGSFDYDPPQLVFTVVVEPDQFAEMLRTVQSGPGAVVINIGIEHLRFGWEPDGSHLIWGLDETDPKRPISTFSYNAERFWTSEQAIGDERERKLNAELADSPDPDARKLAAISAASQTPDPLVTVL